MKKILLTLVVIITGLFLVACDNELDNFKTRIGIGFQGSDSIDNVTQDIVLRNSIADIDITWESDSEAIIVSGTLGKVARQTEDIDVTLTASFNWEGETEKIIFKVKVIASTNESIDFEAIFSQINLPSQVDNNLNLPLTLDGANLSWTSNTPSSLSNDGVVNQSDENVSVELTVTASKDGQSESKTFTVVVLGLSVEPINFEEIFSQINVPSETSQNLSLPTEIDEVILVWSSNKPQTITNNGVVNQSDENVLVELTVTASKGGQSDSKTFTVVVLALSVEPINFEEIFSQINVPSETSQNLSLPTEIDEVILVWSSNKPQTITNNGVITRSDENVLVELKVTASKGGQSDSKTFIIIVLKNIEPVFNYDEIFDQINIPIQLTNNIFLPTSIDGVQLTWDSSNLNAITTTGIVTRGSTDVFVTLTVTAVKTGNEPASKNFQVTVKKVDAPVSDYTPIAEARELAQGASVTIQGVNTSLMSNGNYSLQDASGAIAVYFGSGNNSQLVIGTEYVISGKLGEFNGLVQITSPTIVKTVGTRDLPKVHDLTGYSLDFDDLIIHEGYVITYRNLEVVSTTSPNNAHEITFKNDVGETSMSRLDTRVGVSEANINTFKGVKVGEIIDLTNVTVSSYAGKAQFMFTSISDISVRPKDPLKPQITGVQNFTYIIDVSEKPNYLEGVSATNSVGGVFTSSLTFDDSNVNYQEYGNYEVKITLPDVNGYGEMIAISTVYVRNEAQVGVYEGYYQSLSGLTGSDLNNALQKLIKNTGRATGSTSQVKQVDKVGSSYYLIYTGNGSYGNREHVWPQSKLGSVKDDLHNLRAANSDVNSTRSNYPFVENGKPFTGSYKWEKIGSGFYPGDEHIGDVARIVLYVSIRYNLNLNLVGNLSMFLNWNELDPVNDFERERNDRIEGIQSNRNPFIDHPELVDLYFGPAPMNMNLSAIEIELDLFVIYNQTFDTRQQYNI